MPAGALALLLAAAFGHATWNYLAKGARNDAAFQFTYVAVSLVAYAPVAIIAYAVQRPEIGWEAVAFMAVSGFLHIGYYFLLTSGYRVGDLSLVYPLARGTGPALSVVGAILIFDESPTRLALARRGDDRRRHPLHDLDTRDDTDGQNAGVAVSVAFALATGASSPSTRCGTRRAPTSRRRSCTATASTSRAPSSSRRWCSPAAVCAKASPTPGARSGARCSASASSAPAPT